jgi:hypothetical protein
MHRAIIISILSVFAACACQTKQVHTSSLSSAEVMAFLERFGPASPRLSMVEAFPQEHRAAALATIAAIKAEGWATEEYYATITSAVEGSVEIYLTHQSCPALQKETARGDPCGGCRLAYFYPKEGRLSGLGFLQ